MRTLLNFVAASLVSLTVSAAPCATCIGVDGLPGSGVTVVPTLVHINDEALTSAGELTPELSSAQKLAATVLVHAKVDSDPDPLIAAEKTLDRIFAKLQASGPYGAAGIEIDGLSGQARTFAFKRFAVRSEGTDIARAIVLEAADTAVLQEMSDAGAFPYVDLVITQAASVAEVSAWLINNQPSTRFSASVTPTHANALYDAAAVLATNAKTAYLTTTDPSVIAAIAAADVQLEGDWSADPSADSTLLLRDGSASSDEKPISFVRGEDLRTIVFPPGNGTEWRIASLGGDFLRPQRVDATGAHAITDAAARNGRYLVGLPPAASGYALVVDRPNMEDTTIARDAVDVATERGITVEEIIRRHQVYDAFQRSIEPRYVAHNATKLRFGVGPGGDTIEATLAGPYFSDPSGTSDWVWEDFYVNGVKWKYGRIPELPIVQPEKVTQLPLEIHFTNDYRYELVRQEELRGYRVYEVRFEPKQPAPADLPLYRGTVWIDSRTWARVRISSVQMNLSGEILSNEERVDFDPFDRTAGRQLTSDEAKSHGPETLVWLPSLVRGQQVLSTAGRSTVVSRSTDLTAFELAPENYETRLVTANQSNMRMVRDTDAGLRYLERTASGERVVKEGFDQSQLLLLGGIHHDAGLEFPVMPLGGVDYFNFNLFGKGLQTNVFFAGVILAANLTDPSFRGTRTNVGFDFAGLAVPFENTSYRNGQEVPGESVSALPLNLSTRVGHPAFGFGKIDFQFDVTSVSFQRSENTADDYVIPENTFVLTPSVHARYDRGGFSIATFYEFGTRTKWEPWGDPAEYSEEQKDFTKWGLTLGKSFYLPKFQRIGIEANYMDGEDLDRFSKYELGFFGAQRVRGVRSGSVRAERAIIGHLSYGFVFSDQFRLEAFYDHALIDDAQSGYSRAPFQGIGIAGQTLGPRGTILRLDIGKSVGPHAEDDVVANVMVLKLF